MIGYVFPISSCQCRCKSLVASTTKVQDEMLTRTGAVYSVLQAVLNYSPYDKKCLGVGANAADLWACEQAAQMTHRPLLRGLYEAQVNRWFRAFDRKQVRASEVVSDLYDMRMYERQPGFHTFPTKCSFHMFKSQWGMGLMCRAVPKESCALIHEV